MTVSPCRGLELTSRFAAHCRPATWVYRVHSVTGRQSRLSVHSWGAAGELHRGARWLRTSIRLRPEAPRGCIPAASGLHSNGSECRYDVQRGPGPRGKAGVERRNLGQVDERSRVTVDRPPPLASTRPLALASAAMQLTCPRVRFDLASPSSRAVFALPATGLNHSRDLEIPAERYPNLVEAFAEAIREPVDEADPIALGGSVANRRLGRPWCMIRGDGFGGTAGDDRVQG